jgi:two-component sensor histidine kinase
MTIGLYTFFRLRFQVLVSLGVLQLAAYVLANVINHTFQDHLTLAINNLFFIIGTAVLGFFIAYTFQLLNKKNFLHQKALDAQYTKLLAEFNEKSLIEEELRRVSDQKMIMMKEIHHRVKNNLAIVISMLSLQMRQISDPQIKKIISDIEMRIRSMALIHEHLYRSEDLDRIRLHDYLKSLTSIILSSFSSPVLTLKTDFEPMDVSIETALPIGLITNELLTNSIKYAFPSVPKGMINIRLMKADNQIILELSDNGIGLPEGFQMEEQKTMGMFIVRLLVEQINGEIHVDISQGTSFTINFPFTAIRKPFTK